jgi:hypothetical protein
LTVITKEVWNTVQQTEDKREKIQALSLAKECYSMKLELLTNAIVIEDASRFVSTRSEYDENLKSASSKGDREEPEGQDHDENRDQIEEEQEEKTINQVF